MSNQTLYDMHSHFIPPEVLDWVKDNKSILEADFTKKEKGEFLSIGNWNILLKESMVRPASYLKIREEAGVSLTLVSPARQLFLYEYPDEMTGEMAAVYNRAMADWVNGHQHRLNGLGTVTFTNPEQAAAELKDCMNMGLRGVIIGPGASDYMLSDDFYKPFWEEANHQKSIIFIHPLGAKEPRLGRYEMTKTIGVLWETTIYLTDLILSGFMDRYPNVKILLAHGGGFLPYQVNRIEKGFEINKQTMFTNLQDVPTVYMKRFWYDTVLLNENSFRSLTDLVGEERVVPGSDYPMGLSSWPPLKISDLGVKSLLV